MVFNFEIPTYTKPEVKDLINNLDTCSLKNSGVRVVNPVGDGSSGIMLIGEAPGAKEDLQGEPFVGASGKFLNNFLLPSVNLNRQNIYLTNIVKCRPPENRDPTEEEKQAWTPVLLAEIAWLKPKLIVCLGRHSLSFFIKDKHTKIGEIHGKIIEISLFENYNQKILACYHPAVALYNSSRRQILIDDFSVIKNFVK